jgi:hypothetical protein
VVAPSTAMRVHLERNFLLGVLVVPAMLVVLEAGRRVAVALRA